MRWFIRITLVLLLILAAYTAWPFYGLSQLAAAVEARNANALRERIEFPALRRSLTEQIVLAYLKLTGKDTQLGAVGTRIAVSAGATIADPIVGELLNPEALLDLLNKGTAVQGQAVGEEFAPLRSASLGNVWRMWLSSDYSGRNFSVGLPPDTPAAQQFRLRLRLFDTTWRLVGIDLPEALRVQLAQQVAKTAPK